MRVDLVGFRQKSQEISSFLENSPQLTEDFKKRAKRILAKSKEVIRKLKEFLEKGKENLIQLRPDLQPEIEKLPGLVADVKKIVEDIDNSLGLTTEVTESSEEHTRASVQKKVKDWLNELRYKLRGKKPPQK